MKLYELVGVKKFAGLDFEDVLGTMKDYTKAGQGSSAIAVKHGSRQEVIKFWIKDSGYEEFIKFVRSNPSKHFPKFLTPPKELSSFFLRHSEFPKKIKYVRMEALTPIETNSTDVRDLNRLFWLAKDAESIDDFLDKVKRREDRLFPHSMDTEELKEFSALIYKLVTEALKKKKTFLDIHYGNVMKRGSTFVIIDPFANADDMDATEDIILKLGKYKKELKKHAS